MTQVRVIASVVLVKNMTKMRLKTPWRVKYLALFLFVTLPALALNYPSHRFFYEGPKTLSAEKGNSKIKNLSPRLLAMLDYLQNHFTHGKEKIEVYSAYRSPKYNEGLRKKGKLAGKASLHLEGMAIDFAIPGVDAKQMWDYVRSLNCCGVGYYHGNAIHLDVGPSRFWDETSSKVFTDISNHDKQIWLTTNYDIYHPGETLKFKVVRITEYPFGIKNKVTLLKNGKEWKTLPLEKSGECIAVENTEETSFALSLPDETLKPEDRLKIQLHFCDKPAKEMPDQVTSNPFTIASPGQE